jgi:hypothetical protein
MCILFGLIWNAGSGRELPSQDCDITWVDDSGIGHAADMGFPRPPQAQADLCASGAPGDACRSCQCGACAAPLIKCASDADCKPILDCFASRTADCVPVVDAHSSAVGLFFQARGCLETSGCASVCPQ